jgi:hypothetical protein
VSEKVARERHKPARNGSTCGCRWFGRLRPKPRISWGFGRVQGAEKESPDWRDWRGRGIRTLGTIVASEALSLARRHLPSSTRAAQVDAPKRSRFPHQGHQAKGICRARPGHTTALAQSVRNPTTSAACNKGYGASREPRDARFGLQAVAGLSQPQGNPLMRVAAPRPMREAAPRP